MAKQVKPDFVYITYIGTTPAKLWQALTRGQYLAKYWWGRRLKTTWKVGSPVQTFAPDGKLDWDGKVLVYDRPRRLAYTFKIAGFQKKSSRVEWELERQGRAVKLTLRHYGIERRCRAGIADGWSAVCSMLKSLVERARSMPM